MMAQRTDWHPRVELGGEIIKLWGEGKSYADIGIILNIPKGTVASRCRRLKLVRPNSKQAGIPRPNRKPLYNPLPCLDPDDQRDIDIPCDLDDGHTIADTAARFGVSKTYLQRLSTEARGA